MPLLFTPHYYNTSPRDQYLHQLAREAARERYFGQLDNYYHSRQPVPGYSSYDELLEEARARELYRRQLAARQANQARRAAALEQCRQEQLDLERRQQAQRYLAERERERYLNAVRRAQQDYGAYPGSKDDEDQEMVEAISSEEQHMPVRIIPRSPSPEAQRPQWTLEQKQKAAATIQSFYRNYLARRNTLKSLASIRSAFNNFTSSFDFPSKPSFDSTPAMSSYKLSYNTINAPIHAFEDALMKLLGKLDSIESNGDQAIRKERKRLARDIEMELNRLDQRKEEAWEAYRVECQVQNQETVVDESTASDDAPVIQEVDMKENLDVKPLQISADQIAADASGTLQVTEESGGAGGEVHTAGEEGTTASVPQALMQDPKTPPTPSSTLVEASTDIDMEDDDDVDSDLTPLFSRSESPIDDFAESKIQADDFVMVEPGAQEVEVEQGSEQSS